MQSVIRFIHEHYYDIFIPVTALALLRLAMCFAQLKRTAAIRRKKGVYHSVRDAYAEIGAWLGMLPFLALALAVPAFWPVWAALSVAGGIVVGKLGRKKGLETDDIYREVARELKHEAEAEAAGHRAVAVIAGGHTSFVFVCRDGETLLDRRTPAAGGGEEEDVPLPLARVWDFAMTSPLGELRVILEASRLNKAAAEQAFAGEFGHCVGRTLRCERERKIMGDSIFSRILSYTSAACDARMAGAMIPVMSNSGSGNQGIAATLPVVVYAEQTAATEEQTIRALVLSHLTVIYIKQSLGRLSALCGCVVAATGSSCGITYLMGGDYGQVAAAVKNMIANLTGMICDGAKPSCSMKLTSGVSTAVISAMMAMDGHCVTPVEGIIEEDVDKCIRNLTAIGRDGMNETDRVVLGIMTHKC